MFGTVARLRITPGHQQTLMELQKTWNETQRPAAPGAVAVYVFQSERDPDESTLVAIFKDRESYFANAARPEQDTWYRELREHLQSDPEWVDGEVVFSEMY